MQLMSTIFSSPHLTRDRRNNHPVAPVRQRRQKRPLGARLEFHASFRRAEGLCVAPGPSARHCLGGHDFQSCRTMPTKKWVLSTLVLRIRADFARVRSIRMIGAKVRSKRNYVGDAASARLKRPDKTGRRQVTV